MTTFRDDFRFDSFFFFKDQLENQLGISLSEDSANSSSSKENFDSINKELEPYKSRITINSWEAASLIVNNHPDADWSNTIVQSFKNSILNAVKNGALISTDRNYDVNNELCYAEVYTNDVGLWAKKHNYNWPLPLDENNETNNQNNNEYEQRIKLLEEELNKQKIINSNLDATKSSEQVSINDNRDLTEEINQLKLDNQKLTEQLNEAKQEIEKLTTFIQSNNITELTEEYLKSRERNNYYSLIGGLLYLLLRSSSKNLNQNAIILSLQEAFKGEPFSDRSLQDKFANAKRQLITNHPDIKFD